jgi:hypothetical protein
VRPHLAARSALALAVTLGLLVLTPSPSWACSCAMATTAQHVAQAGTVATGTVAWTATDGQTRTYQVTVDRVYKGAAATSEKLLTQESEAACGLADLATGKRYVFFIDGEHPGTMRVGLCGGTTAYDDAVVREVEAVTGPPDKPERAPADTAGDKTSGDHTALTVALVGGAVLLVVAGAGAVGVRRRSA